jgi:predicted Zn-dependent protease
MNETSKNKGTTRMNPKRLSLRDGRRALLACLAVGLGASLLAGCSKNPTTDRYRLDFIPRDQEIQMGSEAAPKFVEQFGGEVDNGTVQAYVDEIGGAVAVQADRPMPYEFTLVRDETPNAFALPGGKVFITAGLMQLMQNERQLAAVLAHEVAHVSAEHNVDGLQRQMGAEVLNKLVSELVGGTTGQAAAAATQLASQMALLKYTRDDEYEADFYGIRFMARAGYNPWGMVELLERLNSLGGDGGGDLTEMFQTHPLTEKRISEAREAIRSNPDYERFSETAPDPDRQRYLNMRQLLLESLGRG